MKNAIMVIGPNGVGKTEFAYEMARRYNGEIINLDRTYLYRGFPITTGLQDTLRERGVKRHLYELLDADQASFTADTFSEMVAHKINEINSAGRVAIAEGASTLYVPRLLDLNAKKTIFKNVIGFRFSADFNIEAKYRKRINQAFHNGLADEIHSNLAQYENSFLIKECHFAVPTVKYLKGDLDLEQAKEEILFRCLDYKNQQLELFSRYPQIQWFDVSTGLSAHGFNFELLTETFINKIPIN